MDRKQQLENQTRPLVTRAGLARRVLVAPDTVDRLVEQGVLPQPVIRCGRVVRFDPIAVDRALGGQA